MSEPREARPTRRSDLADAGAPELGGPGFEAALDELEALVERLEDGALPLEEALATFERGVALSRRCSELLDRAERRIELLVREGAGLGVHPFEGAAGAPDES